MKTNLSIVVVLSVVCVLLVSGAVSSVAPAGAESTVTHRPSDAYTVTTYLPLVAKPPCLDRSVSAWMSVDKPVVHVGDTFTVTFAFVSEGCAAIYDISPSVSADLTSPLVQTIFPIDDVLHGGEYLNFTKVIAVRP